MKRKKKKWINIKIINILNYNIQQKIMFYKITDIITFERYKRFCFNRQLNKKFTAFKKVCNTNFIIPSDFKVYFMDNSVVPFWNNKIKQISDTIYLPNDENSKKLKNSKITNNSWFNVSRIKNKNNDAKIEITDNKDNKTILVRTRKIKLFLDNKQIYLLKIFINTYRYFYNRTISYINNYDKKTHKTFFFIDPKNEKTRSDTKIEIDLKDNKNYFNFRFVRDTLKKYKPTWLLDKFPSHLIDQAIKEAIKNYNTEMEKYKESHRSFKLHFKSKKNITQTINIEDCYINEKSNSLFTNYKYNEEYLFRNLKSSEKLKKYKALTSTLTFHTVLKTVFLNLTHEIETKENTKKKVASGDPGERTFLTIYSDNQVNRMGERCSVKMHKVCKEIDIIQSRLDRKEYYTNEGETLKMDSKRRKNLRKAMHRKIAYLKNLKMELHNKTIRFIYTNYGKMIIPPYEIKNMVGKLNSKISRCMYNLSYYSFKERLKDKGEEMNLIVEEKGEHYTTKTCTRCGNIDNNIGGKEIYNCLKCKLIIGRDDGAARNIMLKNQKF
jgi:transposase